MSWQQLGLIVASKSWQLTGPSDATLFRIRQSLTEWPPPFRWRGLYALGDFSSGQLELANVRSLYPRGPQESEVIQVSWPASFTERRIAIRGQQRYYATPVIWSVYIDEWVLP